MISFKVVHSKFFVTLLYHQKIATKFLKLIGIFLRSAVRSMKIFSILQILEKIYYWISRVSRSAIIQLSTFRLPGELYPFGKYNIFRRSQHQCVISSLMKLAAMLMKRRNKFCKSVQFISETFIFGYKYDNNF